METIIIKMVEVALLILVGFIVGRLGVLSATGSRDISTIVLNICSPALILSSALSDTSVYSLAELGIIALICAAIYAVLIVFGWLYARISRRTSEQRPFYMMLSAFGNVGFLGIPLGTALLGTEALFPIVIFNIFFNILFYTYGYAVMRHAVANAGDPVPKTKTRRFAFINIGTVACLITVVLYLVNIDMPDVVTETMDYLSAGTLFLSLLVIGISLSYQSFSLLIRQPALWIFYLLRILALPICVSFILRLFIDDMTLVWALTLMCALPAANMPVMLAAQRGIKAPILTYGVVISAVMCLITIPVVMLITM